MKLWAVVPVKPIRSGKSRLAGMLSYYQRQQLIIHILENTLESLNRTGEIDWTIVVSRDEEILNLARSFGAFCLHEDGTTGLNTSLRRATMLAIASGAEEILVLPGDLPYLSTEDIRILLDKRTGHRQLIVSPDRHHDGTNAMFISPIDEAHFAFGPGSFTRHVEEGEKAELEVTVFEIDNIGLDLDLPDDLFYMQRSGKPLTALLDLGD
jgi:2-phospho-L-lactate/phosphoenolpyruvate guanylyltransferase